MTICYLHVGFHKTATTSFQLTLNRNRKQLEKENILLPKFRGKTGEYSSNHSGQIRDIFDENAQHFWDGVESDNKLPDNQQIAIQEHCQSLTQFLNKKNNILISGETISCLPQQSLIRLKEKIEEYGFLINPFALVRAPYGFITSALQQTIKNGEYHPLINLIPSESMEDSNEFKIPNRSDSVKKLNRVFGDSMKYIPFNTATKYSGGPVLFLLEQVLQLKYANQYELIDANISRSNQCTRLKNFFNQHHHHIDKGKLKALFNSISIEKDQAKFLLTEQEFMQFKSVFEEIREEMKNLLGREFVEEKINLSPQISSNEATQILSDISRELYKIVAKRN